MQPLDNNLNFQEYDFEFHGKKVNPLEATPRGIAQIFNVRLRVGNAPIVKNLAQLFRLNKSKMPADLKALYKEKELYSVVHAIGTVSQGAKIEQLVYDAEVLDPSGAQTLDLIPNTEFKKWFGGDVNINLSLSASGNISVESPKTITTSTDMNYLNLGGGISLQTGSQSNLSGEFKFSFQFPVTQSMGISSNHCTWILNPESGKPLNGDQLLMQIIAVPKGSKTLKYRIKAEITADKGWFWAAKTKETKPLVIDIPLLY